MANKKRKKADTKPKPRIVNGKVKSPDKAMPTPKVKLSDAEQLVTDMQWRFVNEYFRDFNATAAARRSGYSDPVWGCQVLKNPRVATLVEKYKEEMREKYKIDQEWLIERFIENHARALQVVPVLDHDGEPTGEYRYEGQVANTALAHIGKITGHMKDRMEMTGRDGKPIEHSVKVEGLIRLELADLQKLSLPARKEVLKLLEAKENGVPV